MTVLFVFTNFAVGVVTRFEAVVAVTEAAVVADFGVVVSTEVVNKGVVADKIVVVVDKEAVVEIGVAVVAFVVDFAVVVAEVVAFFASFSFLFAVVVFT